VPVRTQDGRAVCERCSIADTAVARMRGLLGRSELAAGEGLWIRPTNAIHMFFMRFAIDAVYLDRDDTVVRVVPRLRPWRMSICRGARSVIELAAGEAERWCLQPGDRVEVVRPDVSADAA
jgi:uncharacterized membrane protein (UPF0127 family)